MLKFQQEEGLQMEYWEPGPLPYLCQTVAILANIRMCSQIFFTSSQSRNFVETSQ